MRAERTIRVMVPKTDMKIERLGDMLGRSWRSQDLTALCRLGDETSAPAGTVLQHEEERTRWCYWVVGGSALVSREGEPLMICGPGSMLPGGAVAGRRRAPASVEALEEMDLIAFGVREYLGAIATIKPLRSLLG